MKKITIAIFLIIGMFSSASAELGVNIGVSGQVGVFQATGTESEALERTSEEAVGVAGYTSFFIEKKLTFLPGPLGRLTVGFDHVPETLSSEEASTIRDDIVGAADTSGYVQGAGVNGVTNTVKLDFEDLDTTYIAFNITDNLYIKTGAVTVDIITKESLGTGSTYGNTSVDGTMYGIGFSMNRDNGLFMRFEANHTEFDNAKVTASNTANFVELNNLEGAMGKVSIGKSF